MKHSSPYRTGLPSEEVPDILVFPGILLRSSGGGYPTVVQQAVRSGIYTTQLTATPLWRRRRAALTSSVLRFNVSSFVTLLQSSHRTSTANN